MFTDEFLLRLDGKLSDKALKIVYEELNVFIADFEVKKKSTEIVPYESKIPACYEAFLVTKSIEGKSAESLKQYSFQLEKFFSTVNKSIESITKEDILKYIYMKEKTGSSAIYCDTIRRIFNGFFQWCVDNEYLPRNPCKSIPKIKGEEHKRKPLTETQIEKMRDGIENRTTKYKRADVEIRDKALFEFMLSTGARVGEVVNCNKEDVDYSSIPSTVSLFGKGKKHRDSYLNAKATYYLKQYLAMRKDDNKALFVSLNYPHDRLTRDGILRAIQKYSDDVGERVYPHKIRHTTATQGMKHGMELANMQKLLGHTKPETTLRYADIADEDVKYSHSKYII